MGFPYHADHFQINGGKFYHLPGQESAKKTREARRARGKGYRSIGFQLTYSGMIHQNGLPLAL